MAMNKGLIVKAQHQRTSGQRRLDQEATTAMCRDTISRVVQQQYHHLLTTAGCLLLPMFSVTKAFLVTTHQVQLISSTSPAFLTTPTPCLTPKETTALRPSTQHLGARNLSRRPGSISRTRTTTGSWRRPSACA